MKLIAILRNLFTTKMYLILLLDFLFLIKFSETETYGINKTVGWAYDLSGFSFFIVFILFGFFIGFAFLALLKAKTHSILSVVFFALISFCTLYQDGYQNMILIDNLLMISIFLFVNIFCISLFLKIKEFYIKKAGS